MSDVELSSLTKRYGETLAVDDVSLRVEEGEFFSLLGPSGCGKTTTLRMIAGFVRPNEGQVFIGGEDMTLLPPEKRGIGIVFQNYAIFPHMTVFDNIAFGLKMRKVPKREIRGRVGKALEQVNLDGYERRYQRELSGGEQQRVALARVLITEPKILLLDEPLSALDKKLREEMKYWIKGLQQSLAITTVYVTHDQGEALTMSDRIAVMNRAQVVQIDAPSAIYEHPADRFVTDFIGESNILEARVAAVGGTECRIAVGRIEFAAPRRDGIETGPGGGLRGAARARSDRAGGASTGRHQAYRDRGRSQLSGCHHPLPDAAGGAGHRCRGAEPARPAGACRRRRDRDRLDRGEWQASDRLTLAALARVPRDERTRCGESTGCPRPAGADQSACTTN